MGCDIHGYLEVNRHPNKPEPFWDDVGGILRNRSYNTFSIIANVRNDRSPRITPISEPKGLPLNPSFMAKADSDDDGDDGHSHSWLTYAELAPRRDDFLDEDFKTFIDYMGLLAKRYGENGVRITFWFDN